MVGERMAPGSQRITVVVADDHPLYRDGVVRALTASGQIDVVAEAGDGRAALAAIREHVPDVALVDYRLPELDGVAIAHALHRDGVATRVLLVSAFTDSGVVYRALETGASGFLPKEARREQIVDGVLACARGENVLPPEVAAGLVAEIRLRKTHDAPVLTDREREILRLISDGNSLPEIAKQLFLGRHDREDARPAPVREARCVRPCGRDFECALTQYIVAAGLVGNELIDAQLSQAGWALTIAARSSPHSLTYGTVGVGRFRSRLYTPSRLRARRPTRSTALEGWTDAEVPVVRISSPRRRRSPGYSLVLLGETSCSAAIDADRS